jgi:hypothetical protein
MAVKEPLPQSKKVTSPSCFRRFTFEKLSYPFFGPYGVTRATILGLLDGLGKRMG